MNKRRGGRRTTAAAATTTTTTTTQTHTHTHTHTHPQHQYPGEVSMLLLSSKRVSHAYASSSAYSFPRHLLPRLFQPSSASIASCNPACHSLTLTPLLNSCFTDASSTVSSAGLLITHSNTLAFHVGSEEPDLKEAELTEQKKLEAAAAALEHIGFTSSKVATILKRHRNEFMSIAVSDILARVQALRQQLGMDSKKIIKLLQKCPPLLFPSFDSLLQPLLQLLAELGIDPNPFLGQLMMFSPFMMTSSGEQNVRRFIGFCTLCGLSVEDTVKCLRRFPLVVVFSTQNLFAVLEFYKGFGASPEDMGRIIKDHPPIVTRSVDNCLIPMVKFLTDLGLERDDVTRIVLREPRIFGFNIEQNLKPKIQYLQSIGLRQTDIVKLVSGQPAILRRSVSGSLAAKVEYLVELGFEMGSPSFCRALGWIFSCSLEYLEDRICWFESLGLSRDEVVVMLKGNSSLLRKNHAKLQEKVDYLVNVMGYPVKDLVTHPVFLNLSLEKRIRPRYRVVMWLISMGLLEKNPALGFFSGFDDAQFRKKYVDCHPGCSSVFETKKQ